MTNETSATVPSSDVLVSTGSLSPSMASSRFVSSSMAVFVAGWSALVTTAWRASVEPCGHRSFIRLRAWTLSISSGNEAKSLCPMCSRRAGDASASRKPAERTNDSTGRRMVVRTMRAQTPLPSGLGRPRIGSRPPLMPSPRMASTAGRNVSDPTTEMKTTEIVPIAIDRNSGSSSRKRPAIEIITASPEKKTARPAVLEAVWIARSFWGSSPRWIRRAIDQMTMPTTTAPATTRTAATSTTTAIPIAATAATARPIRRT